MENSRDERNFWQELFEEASVAYHETEIELRDTTLAANLAINALEFILNGDNVNCLDDAYIIARLTLDKIRNL